MSLYQGILKKLQRKRVFTVDTVFTHIPKMGEYALLPQDVKTFVDSIISTGLKSNPELRRGRKKILPLQQDFWQVSYETVVLLREAVQEMQLEEVFQLVYGISEKEFLKLELFNAFACYQWITDQLVEMATIEQNCLGGEPTLDEKNAGVEELGQFGYANNLDTLAGGDILKYDAILLKPYAIVFRKLYMEKVKQDIHKKYLDYVSRKAKRNS
ncbi:hypothetical protein NBRC110019_20790 [Neptunitalea chrysea]|uniref:Uncharacterized protein n=1 Tax=Neptunitalea chrysea TaxID=1647581 RepID=A0A9W6B829_9FLAO|nr:hypothetical protein [Neptunitalea chrysea]GLB53039.1 hypothetical protein NBRC110019_20790 [Neptunitalea chrysea]